MPTSTDAVTVPLKPEGFLASRTTAMPADTNPAGHIFGGWLMSQMDLAGAIHAAIRAEGTVATVAVDGFKFHAPHAPAGPVDSVCVSSSISSAPAALVSARRHRTPARWRL